MKQQPTGERLETFVADVITLEHLHRYAIARQVVKDKIVLDMACGEGYGSSLMADVAASVTGVDIDAATIEKARVKYKKQNLKYQEGSAAKIPADNASFDVVVSFETLEHVPLQDEMLTEVKRVLKPGGLLIISTPDKLYYSDRTGHRNPFHVKELYKEEFAALLTGYFKHQRMFYQCSGLLSVIIPQQGIDEPVSFTGNMETITKEKDFHAPFLLMLASDDAVPVLPAGVFSIAGLQETLLKAQQDHIKKTVSYRLGHTILFPFKFIRDLFKKKQSPPVSR